MKEKLFCAIGVLLNFTLLPGVFAEETRADIYEVTGSSIMIRESADVKSRIVFKVPKGGFILNYNDNMQNQDVVTISGKSGRWLRVMGAFYYPLGYAFEGFLSRNEKLSYRNLDDDCKMLSNRIQCGKDIFVYSGNTPIAGTYYSKPLECPSGSVNIYDKNSAILNKILVSPKPGVAAGANAVMILNGKKILQFIVAPPPSGGGC